MKCDRMKKIIHDYIDGELGRGERAEAEKHLASCPECRKLEESIRKVTVEPFAKIPKEEPPISVWNNIKETILKEEERSFFEVIKENFELTFARHKLALATAGVTVIIACFLVLANIYSRREDPVNSFLNEQMSFLSSLGTNGEDLNGFGEVDFGTDIEKYLL